MAHKVPVALVSMKHKLGDVDFNLERHKLWLERAAGTGARFVGFPEFALTGWIEDPSLALGLESAPIKEIERLARKMRIYIATCFVEKRDGKMYNATFVAGPKGRIGVMRKINLVPKESQYYTSGGKIDIMNVAGFRMGFATCADASCYEMFAIPSLMGAEAIFAPHANSLGKYGNNAGGWLTWRMDNWPGYAREHAVYILGIDCAGLFDVPAPGEEEMKYCGGGAIMDFKGEVIVSAPEPKTKKECMITAELDVAAVRAARKKNYKLNEFRAGVVYNRKTGWRHGRD